MCYIDLKSAQKLFRLPDKINGIYVQLPDIEHTEIVKKELNDKLDYPNNCISWKDLHRNLYAWMALEKIMMTLVLSLIVIIAAFNILSSLIMIVMEKKKDIGILMAMGAKKSDIIKYLYIRE